MNSNDILIMFVALVLGTQLCRFLPEFLPQKVLSSPILQKLNKMLPLVIMLLLLFTSLTFPKSGEGFNLLFAQLFALICVIGSYIWLKNTFLSVILGILGVNLFLSFLS
ncbi:Branched-chain amino acid transport [Mannheimia varigena USDA-ARS-USMARC-1388]|uniref:Branched-chain amino acid transport n=1 Tax=Mannheimia varigena USDA-ARS-USMARC-1296 TaxID=1433287 RepID=W0QBH1_9PAST|nr:AzlD domain-containing protein [Mannheimia varigena]AHG75175.1 Branched-chain amino acid transport [Mannheimia varigena USDA-ARS-USMARC-1296]AHG80040.1 Branched-chain amino acid transport [Mannheimia varigena USDA-ARS-USMARC-1388]